VKNEKGTIVYDKHIDFNDSIRVSGPSLMAEGPTRRT